MPYVASLGKGHKSVGPAAVALRSAAAAVIRIKKFGVILLKRWNVPKFLGGMFDAMYLVPVPGMCLCVHRPVRKSTYKACRFKCRQ